MDDMLRNGALTGSPLVGLWIAAIVLLTAGWIAVAVVHANTTFALLMLLLTIFAPAFLWFLGRSGAARSSNS